MGIKGLKQFLKSKFPSCLQPSHLSHWFGKKVAMDLLPYLYRYKTTYGETWRHGLAFLLATFIKHHVHVTVLMDGPTIYKEKDKEREKRKAGRDKIKQKMEAAEHELEEYKKNGTITPLLESLSGESTHRNLLLERCKKEIQVDVIQQMIDKWRQQMVVITTEDIETVQELCKALYIPFYHAEQEAESLGSFLCKTGVVDAVVTEDTDVLAYGCPHWICNIAHDGTCMEIHLDDILNGLEWSSESFIDFCILCGTDYNESLKGIGPVGAFKAIQTHQTIPEFLKTVQVESDVLQYETCRSIFNKPCSQAIVSKLDKTIVPIDIRFNPILTVASITALKKKYPTQWIRDIIDSYESYITFE